MANDRSGQKTRRDSCPAPRGEVVGGRYQIEELLGEGGMAFVYGARDLGTGRRVALKRLAPGVPSSGRRQVEGLFQREFHTLAELSHPSVIQVYDYGVDDVGPYYTMELLDGGDLRDRMPLPWREACALIHDVCSSLALVHSRRLVHRDVSPRNVRCTADGRAKLIDFGAMAPMGRGVTVVGTVPYIAPEVLQRSSLDARTDLFSLGATLYSALTGRPPYPARSFADLNEAWKVRPALPSVVVEGIPEALDVLVLSLLNIEPATRPRGASEVMQRLASIASVERSESQAVSRAYLATPSMVGREESLAIVRVEMERAFSDCARTVLVECTPGFGRTRFLDACALGAKTLGAVVARASAATGRRERFGVARVLVEQLSEAFVDDRTLSSFDDETLSRVDLQVRLRDWILSLSARHPVAILVDDLHVVDEPSAALLAVVADEAARRRLLVVATVDTSASPAAPLAVEVLRRRSARVALTPLSRSESESLLESLFGNVPNVTIVNQEVHAISHGNPGEFLAIVQHLIDRGLIVYEGGTWTLPDAFDPAELPASAEDVIGERLASLSPLALRFVQTQALASHPAFTREQYEALAGGEDPSHIDRAMGELVAKEVLVCEGRYHALAHRSFVHALRCSMTEDECAERHRALSELYADLGGAAEVHHLLSGNLHERGLDRLLALTAPAPMFEVFAGDFDPAEMAPLFERALQVATRLGRGERDLCELRRWLISGSVVSDPRFYFDHAPVWLERLKLDCGFTDFHALPGSLDPGERVARAMQAAYARYAAAPESERVYRPDQAIRLLALYVSISIAIGVRTQNGPLLGSVPPLLEPFVNLSPLLQAIWENAIATCETTCLGKLEQARMRWLRVYERLADIGSGDIERADLVRRAVAYGIGVVESRLGFPTATRWADLLDEDPLHRVNALYLRKIVSLQRGDWDAAERHRRQAESAALGAPPQMFSSSPIYELAAHGHAGDLIGVKQMLDRIEPLAERYEGYRGYRMIAEGLFAKLRGNLEEARSAFARALELTEPDPEHPWRIISGWPRAVAGMTETLVELDRCEEAREVATRALEKCNHGMGLMTHDIVRALGLAEAKLGEHTAAMARLDAIIADESRLGITGMNLGVCYETRARIAIWAGDSAGVREYAQLTAREYRHGRGSPLGARYERLMDEARSAVSGLLPALSDFDSSMLSATRVEGPCTDAGATGTVHESVEAPTPTCADIRAPGATTSHRR